jgi:hypothetical protein
MRRATLLWPLALLFLAACGISSAADYRKATTDFVAAADRLISLTDGDQASARLARANDGMEMRRAFESALSASAAMVKSLPADLKIKNPAVAAVHQDMAAAAAEHDANLRALSDDLGAGTFGEVKAGLRETVETFQEALDAWDEGLSGL